MTAFDDSAAVAVLTCAEYRAAAGVDRCISAECARCWPDASPSPREFPPDLVEAARECLSKLCPLLTEVEKTLAGSQ